MKGNYHHWTTGDLALILRHYGRRAPEPLPPAELARRIGVSEGTLRSAVRRHRARLPGVAQKSPTRLADVEADLRRLHAEGLGNEAIAGRLGLWPSIISKWVKQLSLKAQGHQTESFRALQRARLRRTFASVDAAYPFELAQRVWAVRAAAAGWPLAETPLQLDVLDSLELGPCSRRALCVELGRSMIGVWVALSKLRQVGLVVPVRVRSEDSRTGVRHLWRLADGVSRGCHGRPAGKGKGSMRTVREPAACRVAMG